MYNQADEWNGEHWEQLGWTTCSCGCDRRAVVGHDDVHAPIFCCRGCFECHEGRYSRDGYNPHNKECNSNLKYNNYALSDDKGRAWTQKDEKKKWEEKRVQLSAAPPRNTTLSDTVGIPPAPPTSTTQPKGIGKSKEIPAKARPASYEPPPLPALITRPRRSEASSVDPHRRRVLLHRSAGLRTMQWK